MLEETEWLTCSDPIRMLEFLCNGRTSDRKLRLFAVACSRRAWELIDDSGRDAVEVAERFADDQGSAEELREARLACKSAGGHAVWYAAASNAFIAARNTILSIQSGAEDEASHQADLLRDIFGNPFQTVDLDSWKTTIVIELAQTIYDERAFRQIPTLGDALAKADCSDREALDHCRQQVGHVRGCWVVDLLLGKK